MLPEVSYQLLHLSRSLFQIKLDFIKWVWSTPPSCQYRKWFGVNETLSAGCDNWCVNGLLLIKPSASKKAVASCMSMMYLTVWHVISWQLEGLSLPVLWRIFQCQSLPKLHWYFSIFLDQTTINHSVLYLQLTFLEIVNQPDSPLFIWYLNLTDSVCRKWFE